MKTFKEFQVEANADGIDESTQLVLQLALMMESETDDLLSEDTSDYITEGVASILDKAGLHVSKSSGLLDYAFKGAKLIGKLFVAAIKNDTAEVKSIANTEIKKEDLIDFLMKLDQATMHLVTGPIHFIDAVTGWHVGAAVAHAVETTAASIKKGIESAKNAIHHGVSHVKLKAKMLSNITRIEALIPQLG
ncbi:MAG: hypothetical protein R8M45_04380 [Ghiorsea sp.]